MTFPTSLVLATTNAHKATELQALLDEADLVYKVLTLADVGFVEAIDETGSTFEENAYIKAVHVHRATGMRVLADDSGLEVHVLDGDPGVRSARYAGEDATDATNRAKLSAELRHRAVDSSAAQFRCALCFVDDTRILFAEGSSKGTIINTERGSNGFGYDSMFVPDGDTRTYGEVTPAEKRSTSHRSRAMQNLILQLKGEAPSESTAPTHPRHQLVEASIYAVAMPERLDTFLAKVSPESRHAVYEILLQSYLFGGFPTALDALQACYRVFGAPQSIGEVGVATSEAEVIERGSQLCREIYGNVYDKMMDTLSAVSPDLSRWMITEGYGKTLSRPGVDTVTRELCIVAMLTVMGRKQQLISHVRGSLRVGATLGDLRDVEHSVTELCGAHVSRRLLDLIHLQEARLADQ